MTVTQGFKYVAVALAGAGIGGLLGVLLAPASGREMRRMVLRRVDETKDDLVRGGERMFERVVDRVEDEIREVRHKIA
jgi:gas vesicle protein